MKTDLDALERVAREMTAGEWTVAPLRVLGLWSVLDADIDAERHGDILGIVALRNAAESLIGELRLARKVVEAAKFQCGPCVDDRCRRLDCEADGDCECTGLCRALAAYQTATEEA